MLVTMKQLLDCARAEKTAVPAFNIYNVETIQAVTTAAKSTKCPVILSFGESYFNHVAIETIAAAAKAAVAIADITAALHLDHAKKPESIQKAIQVGFTSVMYDGSQLPFKENILRTREIVELASKYGVSVEGELGYLNPEDGSFDSCWNETFTPPDQAVQFVEETQVDALAIAVGNKHGLYSYRVPTLDFKRILEIASRTNIPLVLHGASGIPESSIKQAIRCGVTKININTELAVSGADAIHQYINDHPNETLRLEKLLSLAMIKMEEVVANYIKVLQF